MPLPIAGGFVKLQPPLGDDLGRISNAQQQSPTPVELL